MSVTRLLLGAPVVKAATIRSADVVVPPASRRSCSDQSSWELMEIGSSTKQALWMPLVPNKSM